MLLDPGLWAGAEAGLVGDVRFSAVFASAVDFGFTSLAGKMEGLAVVAAGRLGGAAGTKPEARLMGFIRPTSGGGSWLLRERSGLCFGFRC